MAIGWPKALAIHSCNVIELFLEQCVMVHVVTHWYQPLEDIQSRSVRRCFRLKLSALGMRAAADQYCMYTLDRLAGTATDLQRLHFINPDQATQNTCSGMQ